MNWLKENWFKAGLLFVLALVAISLLYYLVFFLPQKEQTRITEKEEIELEGCLDEASKNHISTIINLLEVKDSKVRVEAMNNTNDLYRKSKQDCYQN